MNQKARRWLPFFVLVVGLGIFVGAAVVESRLVAFIGLAIMAGAAFMNKANQQP